MANILVANGPIRDEIGINYATNVIGPHSEANSVIGRAYTLMSKTIGGLHSGKETWSSLGRPVQHDGWYGMTSRGCEVWEEHYATFSDSPLDWSGSWRMDVDRRTGIGYVNGVSKEICESAIAKHAGLDIVVDSTSFKHNTIDRKNDLPFGLRLIRESAPFSASNKSIM